MWWWEKRLGVRAEDLEEAHEHKEEKPTTRRKQWLVQGTSVTELRCPLAPHIFQTNGLTQPLQARGSLQR